MRITLRPSIRARFGKRWYYLTTMKAAEAARMIKAPDELYKAMPSTPDEAPPKAEWHNVEPMVQHLQQDNRFYTPLVVALKGGEPEFIPLEISDQQSLLEPDAFSESIGILRFNGTEEYIVLDGKHRLESIKQALQTETKQSGKTKLASCLCATKNTPKTTIGTP